MISMHPGIGMNYLEWRMRREGTYDALFEDTRVIVGPQALEIARRLKRMRMIDAFEPVRGVPEPGGSWKDTNPKSPTFGQMKKTGGKSGQGGGRRISRDHVVLQQRRVFDPHHEASFWREVGKLISKWGGASFQDEPETAGHIVGDERELWFDRFQHDSDEPAARVAPIRRGRNEDIEDAPLSEGTRLSTPMGEATAVGTDHNGNIICNVKGFAGMYSFMPQQIKIVAEMKTLNDPNSFSPSRVTNHDEL